MWLIKKWEDILKQEWLWKIDEELGIHTDSISNDIYNIKNINFIIEFDNKKLVLKNKNEIIWVIEYTKKYNSIHINFLATSNWNLEKITSDDEFKQTFQKYFLKKNKNNIKWAWKELLLTFIKKNNSWDFIEFTSLEESNNFYLKILNEFKLEWLINFQKNWNDYKIEILNFTQ